MRNSILSHSILLIATAFSFVTMPLGFVHRNPPFHKWGGLDVPDWNTAFFLVLTATMICLAFRASRLANKWVCYGSLCVNLVLLAEIVGQLLISMARGTI